MTCAGFHFLFSNFLGDQKAKDRVLGAAALRSILVSAVALSLQPGRVTLFLSMIPSNSDGSLMASG